MTDGIDLSTATVSVSDTVLVTVTLTHPRPADLTVDLEAEALPRTSVSAWSVGSWLPLATTVVVPDGLSWKTRDRETMADMLFGATPSISFAVAPVEPNGETTSQVRTNYIVRTRQRLTPRFVWTNGVTAAEEIDRILSLEYRPFRLSQRGTT